MIYVRVEMPVLLEDEDGTVVPMNATGRGMYEAIPDALYRRNRWLGLFRRLLVLVEGCGRRFWIDENYRRFAEIEAAARGSPQRSAKWKAVLSARASKRGCGCGEKKG